VTARRVRPVGDRALLVEVEGTDAVHAAVAAVRARRDPRVADVVAGDRTVLVVWREPPVDPAVLEGSAPPAAHAARRVTVPVTYDGPDLDEVAGHAGCSPEEVARRHAAAHYRVAFVGFAPGFGYLVGGDPRLHVARRDDPRERVPAGSVALAGPYSAVYPTASPGGWRLIGRTDLRMFDVDRDPPSLLEPGVEVVFAP
jgi:KipI family sensor histidine kinase inhibitor